MSVAPAKPRLASRKDAARTLGCSLTKVRRLEAQGKLQRIDVPAPAGSSRPPRVRYRPEQVLAVREELAEELEPLRERRERRAGPARWTEAEGKVAARVFRLLQRGADLRQIVIEEEIPPAVVRELRAEFARTFERDDQERSAARRRHEDKAEQREHDRRAARQEREDRLARADRLRRLRPAREPEETEEPEAGPPESPAGPGAGVGAPEDFP